MSWATHELENYFIQRHAGTRVSFLAVAVGAFAPDLLTKGFVYGFHVGSWGFDLSDPVRFHRGWPGAGFTHSLLFGAVVAAVILRTTRSRAWALGFLIGHWAHVLTDINDTVGTMLFFPFSLETISSGMWKHAGYTGRYGDAAAYYSSPGGLWDTFWLLVVLLFARKTLSREYFRTVIVPADPRAWAWLHRTFRLPERGLLALYRGWLFYGGCRIVGWTVVARVRARSPVDYSWGGPHYIRRIDLSPGGWWDAARSATIGAALLALTLYAGWRLVVRRHWYEGRETPVAAGLPVLAAGAE